MEMPMEQRVLIVGQCFFDYRALSRVIQSCSGVAVPADSADDALRQLRSGPFVLALVNRAIDGDSTAGLSFIEAVRADPGLAVVPVMLISDYPEAQEQAVARGALPGFGKSQVGDPRLCERLRRVLAGEVV